MACVCIRMDSALPTQLHTSTHPHTHSHATSIHAGPANASEADSFARASRPPCASIACDRPFMWPVRLLRTHMTPYIHAKDTEALRKSL